MPSWFQFSVPEGKENITAAAMTVGNATAPLLPSRHPRGAVQHFATQGMYSVLAVSSPQQATAGGAASVLLLVLGSFTTQAPYRGGRLRGVA